MRIRSVSALVVALAAVPGVDAPAEAQASPRYQYCRASHQDSRRYLSGLITMPSDATQAETQRMRDDFRRQVNSRAGAAVDCFETSPVTIEAALRREMGDLGSRGVRTEWTGDYLFGPNGRASLSAGAGREVSIAPPAASVTTRPVDTGFESDSSRRAVDARYQQQQDQVRSIAENNARQEAEHRARVAEADRQAAAHRAAVAANAREQEAYRQSRAQWEANIARCRAERTCAPQ